MRLLMIGLVVGSLAMAAPWWPGNRALAAEEVTGTSFVPSGEPRVTPRAKSFLDDKLIKDAAKAIDALIDAGLARDQIKPQPRTKDPQFLRRVYLDLAGRIPTIDETLEFLASTKADKRNALVRRLLDGVGPDGAADFVSSLRRALDTAGTSGA